jgi:hypothetical protein
MSLDFRLFTEDQDGNEHCVLDVNITHNLNTMADAAGIYKALWRPEEIGAERAKDVADLLRVGLVNLKASPWKYVQYNDEDGWGTYEQFIPFVEEVLEACDQYPSARIRVSR